METRELRPGYRISRIIRGGWQLAGGHGEVEREAAIADLVASAEAGILTFDCADIYTGVEELIGAARRVFADRHGAAALKALKVHTKSIGSMSAPSSSARCAGWGRSGWIWCSSIGGIMRFRAAWMRCAGSRSCAKRARSI
jgi:aryl-alcohol dehydrogenase-like predicted oxidoreductase